MSIGSISSAHDPGVPGGKRQTVSIPEAGEILGISRMTAYKLARSGEMPTIKLGHRKLVPLSWVNQLLATGTPVA